MSRPEIPDVHNINLVQTFFGNLNENLKKHLMDISCIHHPCTFHNHNPGIAFFKYFPTFICLESLPVEIKKCSDRMWGTYIP